MSPTTTIDDLPDDVLVEIFSYFTFSHLMKSVQHVCQRWKHVVQFSDLWINLTYVPNEQGVEHDKEVITMLRQAPKLRTLNLRARPVDYSVLHGALDHCHNLRRLELNGRQKFGVGVLNSLLQECPLIEYLHLPNEVLNKVECSEVIARFENLQTLVVGEISDQWEYPAVLKPLADGCPALRHLNLLREMHTHDDLGYFLDRKKDQLVSLAVGWTSADWMNTIPLLVVCRSLNSLHIDSYYNEFCNDYMDIEIEPHFEPFKFLSRGITSLTLSKLNYITLSDIVGIFSNKAMSHLKELRIIEYGEYSDELGKVIIENCPHLTLLHITDCYDLSDSSVETVYTLQDLENLNLSHSSLSRHGMKSIIKCEGLKFLYLHDCQKLKVDSDLFHLKNLQVLNLSNCDVSGLPLHLLPSTLKRLRVLDLMYSENVDQESLTDLKRLMPHLLIKYKKYHPFAWHDDSNVVFMCPPVDEPTLGEAAQA
ncbi:F-box and leucine-rich repeat protein 13-like [Anabrus simplex]|uniref:F-box and leucine-rich repeat protein 13-like n=1 Tax=Anabrus simplex TaxID=316456 RepID=UPI0035A34C44